MGDFIENNRVTNTPHIFGCSLRNLSVSAPSTSGSLASITVEVVQDLEQGDRFTLLEINPTLLSLQEFDLSLEALNIRGVIKGYDFSEIDISGTGVFSVYLEEVPTYNQLINALLPNTEELVVIHSENQEILTLRRGYSIIEGVNEFHKVTDDSLFMLVGGLPQTNVKRAVQVGDAIIKTDEGVNQIMIQFDVNGIKTRYSKSFKPNSDKDKVEDMQEEVDELYESNDNRTRYEHYRPGAGLGIITSKSEITPHYDIARVDEVPDLPIEQFLPIGIPAAMFFPTFVNVRNLAEPATSPGTLPVGSKVNVSIYREDGYYIPYIEVSPQVFAPPTS